VRGGSLFIYLFFTEILQKSYRNLTEIAKCVKGSEKVSGADIKQSACSFAKSRKVNDFCSVISGRKIRICQIDHRAYPVEIQNTSVHFKPSLRYDYPLIPPNSASRPIRDHNRLVQNWHETCKKIQPITSQHTTLSTNPGTWKPGLFLGAYIDANAEIAHNRTKSPKIASYRAQNFRNN